MMLLNGLNLTADGLLEKMNIVVFTASSDHKMFEQITKSGVKEVLKKPCSIYDLGELIKRFSPADST
jgi:FixJ family two-component response regulator